MACMANYYAKYERREEATQALPLLLPALHQGHAAACGSNNVS